MVLKSLFPTHPFVLFAGFSAFLNYLAILVWLFILKNKALKSRLELWQAGLNLLTAGVFLRVMAISLLDGSLARGEPLFFAFYPTEVFCKFCLWRI